MASTRSMIAAARGSVARASAFSSSVSVIVRSVRISSISLASNRSPGLSGGDLGVVVQDDRRRQHRVARCRPRRPAPGTCARCGTPPRPPPARLGGLEQRQEPPGLRRASQAVRADQGQPDRVVLGGRLGRVHRVRDRDGQPRRSRRPARRRPPRRGQRLPPAHDPADRAAAARRASAPSPRRRYVEGLTTCRPFAVERGRPGHAARTPSTASASSACVRRRPRARRRSRPAAVLAARPPLLDCQEPQQDVDPGSRHWSPAPASSGTASTSRLLGRTLRPSPRRPEHPELPTDLVLRTSARYG